MSNPILHSPELNFDFRSTQEDPIYADYWKGNDLSRDGNDPSRTNKYWTNERWWNQSGYNDEVAASQSLFPDSLLQKSTLVDLGCGKGQAVLNFALDWPLRSIIGVELNEPYLKIFKKNLHTLKAYLGPKASLPPLQIHALCATKFKFTADINMAFLFNPFGPLSSKAVLKNLLSSLDSHPRDFYILYVNANHKNIFLDSGRFKIFYHPQSPRSKYFILKGG